MPIDAAMIAASARERERLRRLVDRMSDQDLRRPLGPDWTVADALAHLAFWDRRALVLFTRMEQAPDVAASPVDVQVINDAMLYLAKRLPPRAAAEEAVAAAEAVDQLLESASPERVNAARAARAEVALDRSEHRREHLDEIEQVVGR